MAKYLMLGKYSAGSIKGISAERTKKVRKAIEKAGGKVDAIYVLLGNYDLAFVVDFPGTQEVMKTSIELTRLTGIFFTTSPALTVEEFDKMIG